MKHLLTLFGSVDNGIRTVKTEATFFICIGFDNSGDTAAQKFWKKLKQMDDSSLCIC
jgi:hypothetical protein